MIEEYRVPNEFNYGKLLCGDHLEGEALSGRIRRCTSCFAHNECNVPLYPLSGGPSVTTMVVARNPGSIEDIQMVPYDGREPYVNLLLTYLLDIAKLPLPDLYFTYAMFCHTIQNRKPLAMELTACLRWKQHEFLGLPKLRRILLLGDDVMKQFGFRGSIIRHWGKVYRHEVGGREILIIPSFHPMKVLIKPEFEGEYREFFKYLGENIRGGKL